MVLSNNNFITKEIVNLEAIPVHFL